MALETAFRDLATQCHRLHGAVLELQVTLDDKPLHGSVVLVERLGDAALDVLGWLDGTLAASAEGLSAVEYPADLELARRALATCHERFNVVAHRFLADVAHHDRQADLARLGRERGGEWRAWSGSVAEALDICWPPYFALQEALFECWKEVVDRASGSVVSVRTTTIGQQVQAGRTSNGQANLGNRGARTDTGDATG